MDGRRVAVWASGRLCVAFGVQRWVRHAYGNRRGHIPQAVADRVSLQADKAEFSPQILLRRVCQRHQNPDMGHPDCQFAAFNAANLAGKTLEFLRAGTMVRIVLMEYLNMNNFFNMPDADIKKMREYVKKVNEEACHKYKTIPTTLLQ